jgi:hypothetical protein
LVSFPIDRLREISTAFASDLPSCALLVADWQALDVLQYSLVINGLPLMTGLHTKEDRGDWDALSDLVLIFDRIQQTVIEFGVGQAWPACPAHGNHPLRVSLDGWICPEEVGGVEYPAAFATGPGTTKWPFGSFSDGLGLSVLPRGDHTIRWYRRDWGWGVIADPECEVWFHVNRFREPAPDHILEGAGVDYELYGSQGLFRGVRLDSLTLFEQ